MLSAGQSRHCLLVLLTHLTWRCHCPFRREALGQACPWGDCGLEEEGGNGEVDKGGLMGIKHIVLVIKTEAEEEFKDGNEEITGGLVDCEPTPSCEVFTIKAVNTRSS